jgi:NAD(P)-dependent dehydrogenase (short-subunit alcohol dehydrogenase family)
MSASLNGKRVVVLGKTSGIGLATAKATQREGPMIAVASSRRQRVDHALTSLENGAEVTSLTSRMRRRCGSSSRTSAPSITWSIPQARHCSSRRWMLCGLIALATSSTSAFGAHSWLQNMAAPTSGWAAITLTNGVAGLRPRKGRTVVVSVCGAMEALTRALAVELAPIRVNVVCPGIVRTELWNDMTETDREAMYRDPGQRLPVGRIGEPEDLAHAYVYLMREEYSTGQVVVVDGGAVLV